MSVVVYLGLGSNLTDKRENLSRAVELIGNLPCTSVEAVSEYFESAPQGLWSSDAAPDFVNICVRIRTAIPPLRLLDMIKDIERRMGREESVRYVRTGTLTQRVYSDRIIDIDILLYGKRKINNIRLQVPHPRMQERDFVMKPLSEVIKER